MESCALPARWNDFPPGHQRPSDFDNDDDGTGSWIRALRSRLARGELAGLDPTDADHGAAIMAAERAVRIMLAARDGLDDFRRLRNLIG